MTDNGSTDDRDTKVKGKSTNRLSFRLSTLSSPTRKGLLDTVTKSFTPSRRPATPNTTPKRDRNMLFTECDNSLQGTPSRKISAPKPSPRKTMTSAIPTESSDAAGVHSWSDNQLARKYSFKNEVGCGNWGSCWTARDRQSNEESERASMVAIKLVYRKNDQVSNARVKALWNEYKVLKSCGKPVHRNLVDFREFVITPSYALVVMKYYRQAMNVALPVSTYGGASGYFQQLLSSVSWLHSRNVTHCDIKVANLLVDTSQDKIKGHPILVDFGFATLHDESTQFRSKQTWGTPEYLSPERSKGEWHDERLSDIWALGVTFFEIATGRTPFEHEDEQFLNKEELGVYHNRTMKPRWVGYWTIPDELHQLCRSMLQPDPSKRIIASDALQSPLFHRSINELQSNAQIRSDHYYPTMLRRDDNQKTAPKAEKRKDESNEGDNPGDINAGSIAPLASACKKDTPPKEESRRSQSAEEEKNSIETSPNTTMDFADASCQRQDDNLRGEKDYSDQKIKGDDVAIVKHSPMSKDSQYRQTAAPIKRHTPSTAKASRPKSMVRPKGKSGVTTDRIETNEPSGMDVENMETLEIRNNSEEIAFTMEERNEFQKHRSKVVAGPSKIIEGETEQLAAQLEEMGALAERLAAMVQESKGKLSQMQETSALRSPRVHQSEKQSVQDTSSKAHSHNRRASFSSRFTALENHRMPESTGTPVHSPPPAAWNRSSGINALRRKLSHTLMIRKDTTQSKIPFPSGNMDATLSSEHHSTASPDDTLSFDERAEETSIHPPITPRRQVEGVTRASSTRGRTLSQFLTRYGVRRAPNTLDSAAETNFTPSSHHNMPGVQSTVSSRSPLQPLSKAVPIATLTRGAVIDHQRSARDARGRQANDEHMVVSQQKSSLLKITSTETPRVNRPLSRIYQTVQKTPMHAQLRKQENATAGVSQSGNEDPAVAAMKEHPTPSYGSVSASRQRQESHPCSVTSQTDRIKSNPIKIKSQKRPISSGKTPSTNGWLANASLPYSNEAPLRPFIGQDPPERDTKRKEIAHRSFIPVSPRGNLWNRLFRTGGNNVNDEGSFIPLS